uniref:Flagellar associated protein n=1 Tax=Chlamydomonas leiostraca TaxID=1034604 RepID=A0A7S0RKV2_9CHLO|mmetsp:Transcript_25465/g.64632  ORF Transcript_25465/g.64632 Transcript_25465/m.64632 type:complete len:303 (+) Transcript_25465:148-1056(+)
MTVKTGDDPSTRMLRSGFGKQVKSEANTMPSWGFGSSHRDAFMKLYLSREQANAMSGNNSQGPVYKSYGAIGPQPESKYASMPAPGFGSSARSMKDKRGNYPGPGTYVQEGGIGPMVESKRATSPRAVFGSATRDQQSKVWLDDELMKTYGGRDSPGPCTYGVGGGIGKIVDSKYPTMPAWRQGSAARFSGKDGPKDQPGVGAYTVNNNAMGKQTLSNKKTLPSPKIGTSNRDAAKKIFISKEHEKGAYGEWSPGPVTSKVVNSFGTQALSVKKSNPSWGFGTSKRWNMAPSEAPGPGTYWA